MVEKDGKMLNSIRPTLEVELFQCAYKTCSYTAFHQKKIPHKVLGHACCCIFILVLIINH